MDHRAEESTSTRQHRHYEYLQELRNFASGLSNQIQQRIPVELLSNLANALLDETVFEIVAGLKEIQDMTEKTLSETRAKLVQRQLNDRVEKQRRHRDAVQSAQQSAAHRLPLIQRENEREMKEHDEAAANNLTETDRRILTELDQLVLQQQSTLEQAGVPGFYVTTNPQEVQVQMQLLIFISRLSSMKSRLE